jgi:hypothetical protein
MGTLRLESGDNIWLDKVYPCISCMNCLGTFLSASFLLRRELFRICWAAAGGHAPLSNLFRDVIFCLRGTGMTHIILIDEYLCHRYKELLSIRMLVDNRGMREAWRFLSSLPAHEVYFAKILYDKEKTACLNSSNFPLHVAAAVAAARFDNPSMVHYRGPEVQTQCSAMLSSMVQEYLTRRGLRLPPKAMINENSETDIVPSANSSQERGQAVFLPPPPLAQ